MGPSLPLSFWGAGPEYSIRKLMPVAASHPPEERLNRSLYIARPLVDIASLGLKILASSRGRNPARIALVVRCNVGAGGAGAFQ